MAARATLSNLGLGFLLAVGCLAGCSTTMSAPAHRATTSTGSAVGTSRSTGTTIVAVAPCKIVIGLSFANAEHGYVLVETCSGWLDVETTHDGGRSWQEVSRVRALSNRDTFDASRAEDKVAFVSERVGVVQPGTRTLLVTDDGGRSWNRTVAAAVISDLFTASRHIWVVTSCPDGGCRSMVASVSTAGFGTWRALPPGATAVEPAGNTWMIGGLKVVWTSSDEGVSWQEHPHRFTCGLPLLAAANSRHWWMLCNDGMADGAEAKAVYISHNDGSSWELTAQTQAFGLTHPIGQLEALGYADALVAVSPTTVLMGVDYPLGGVELSTDAGRDWRIIRTNPEDVGSQTGGLVCIGTSHCWTSSSDLVMHSTADLLQWKAVVVG